MNKELVEIRQGADPSDSEEPGRRAGSDLRDEPLEVLALSHFRPSPLSESLEGTRQDEARTSKEVVFSQHEMGGEVVTSPALDQGGNGRTELLEEIAKLKALLRVKRNISHAAGVYGAAQYTWRPAAG